jgi:hypothetical protein
MVPCGTGSGGVPDEEGPWELEYSPPSESVVDILREMRLGEHQGITRAAMQAVMECDDRRIRQLAASATVDLRDRVSDRVAGVTMVNLAQSLGNDGVRVLPVHRELIACVNEIHGAAQPDARPMGSWWKESHERLQTTMSRWLAQVPAAILINRTRRQQLKRDVLSSFAYVSQYAWLLRANHANQLLVEMINILEEICEKLGQSLEDLGHRPGVSTQSAEAVGAGEMPWSRALVTESDERHWRQMLGSDASLAADVVAAVIGETGQEVGLQLRQVCNALMVQARPQSQPYSESEVEGVLAKMQELGLAIRLPASALRLVGSAGRSAPRRRSHVGRTWWINPLGEVLAAPER